MFAVKGWAVDASTLKPQTEPFKAARSSASNDVATSNKKRKRGTEGPTGANEQDVGKLWDKHIEGKKQARSQVKKEVGKTSQKVKEPVDLPTGRIDDEVESSVPSGEVNAGPDSKQKKKKKHEARESKDGKHEEGLRAEKKERRHKTSDTPVQASRSSTTAPVQPEKLSAAAKLTPLQSAMRQKLISARFRHLNETLYTQDSGKAFDLFTENPEMFEDYHSGFRQQVSVWPENPVDKFIDAIRLRGNVRMPSQKKAMRDRKKRKSDVSDPEPISDARVPPLPRTRGTSIIADLGCGDARLAQLLKDSGEGQKLNVRVHSYDLYSPSPLVTKADISDIPLADGAADIAIFCLALMGTNWITFIEEAYRILHWKGELWVAEIKSRFGRISKGSRKPVEHSVGGKRKQAALIKAQEAKNREVEEINEQETLQVEVDGIETKDPAETSVEAFVDVLKRRGFVLKDGESSIDIGNKMFVKMEFIKAAAPSKGKGAPDSSMPQSQRDGTGKMKPKMKFVDDQQAEEATTDDESKVLKPCLYKVR